MCGLTGGWWAEPTKNIDQLMSNALDKIIHRGPDDNGFEILDLEDGDGKVALGHTRLSVIDLSSAGHQPMFTDDRRFSLVFNGEIYNYIELRDELKNKGVTFTSDSDTEVLIKCWSFWGTDCLDKLDGMFAFVVFDRKQGTLTCVRDQFGIKPFFYESTDAKFIFASELPAVLELREKSSEPNLQVAYNYLVHGEYDSSDNCFIDGIKQLRPGHYMVVDLNKTNDLEIVEYWSAENIIQRDISFEDAVPLVREQFLKNVKLQLRSDVPLGVTLSGGVDSSAIVCAAKFLYPDSDIHTFSFIASNNELSEEKWVDIVNSFVGAKGHKVIARKEELAEDLEDMIVSLGEPFGSTSIYAQYRVLKLAKNAGMTVTLDGQGADELLAGYDGYSGQRIRSLVNKGQFINAFSFLKNWAKWPRRNVKLGFLLFAKEVIPNAFYKLSRKMMGRSALPNWIDKEYLLKHNVILKENRIVPPMTQRGRRVSDYLKYVIGKRGLPSLLRHGDRNSMRFSIESRVPFLTVDLAELLLSLPESYLISDDGETKRVFREAMRGIVPDEILFRKDKVGFETPEHEWLFSMYPKIQKWVEGADNVPFIGKNKLLIELDKISKGKQKFDWRVWRWINYVVWYNIYIDNNEGVGKVL